ncbi:MAG: signal peptidase [Chloroflexota bacterium]|jgi:signal peptidase II|nr:signal peptidase [Chloroflexota bacterium]
MSVVAASPTRTSLSGTARAKWFLFFGLAAIVVIVDQLSKAWVAAAFQPASTSAAPGAAGGPTQVLGDWVRIAVSHNSGGIFGLAGSSAPILGLASLVVIGFIVVYQKRQGIASHPLLTVALGLLLGGAVGNLIDRLRLGYVIDWVDMGIGDLRWYTFNVADAAISIALVLLIAISLLGERLGMTVGTAAAPEASAPR